ncbi:MAG: VWA domain-containing protein, partial [Flavobacteriaceae bacterium]|nr:VWA domain-containing protein [Flavobacteriaceae bacterium]
ESFYYGTANLKITAQYFDNNYEFDGNSNLVIKLDREDTKQTSEFPFLIKNSFYEVDLSSLEAGKYKYRVSASNKAISRSGSFTIIPFNVEEQFFNADVTKLDQIATNSGTSIYYPNQVTGLIDTLKNNKSYRPIQKSKTVTSALVNWKHLLTLLIALLTTEWLIRKYKGLI